MESTEIWRVLTKLGYYVSVLDLRSLLVTLGLVIYTLCCSVSYVVSGHNKTLFSERTDWLVNNFKMKTKYREVVWLCPTLHQSVLRPEQSRGGRRGVLWGSSSGGKWWISKERLWRKLQRMRSSWTKYMKYVRIAPLSKDSEGVEQWNAFPN